MGIKADTHTHSRGLNLSYKASVLLHNCQTTCTVDALARIKSKHQGNIDGECKNVPSISHARMTKVRSPLVEKRTFNIPKLDKRASYMNRPADIWIP